MIIYHHNDLDGKCAAAIMAMYAKNLGLSTTFKEVDYKDKINPEEIDHGSEVAIVDFSFKPEVMSEVLKRTKAVIWCDHHATAKAYGYDSLRGYRDFSDKGLSGCECTWKFCFPEHYIPRSVFLIGEYDSWRVSIPECFEFYEGLKLENCHPSSEIWHSIICDEMGRNTAIDRIISNGKSSIKYRDNYCSGISRSYGYEAVIDGHKAYAMNLFQFGSKQFGDKFEEYPVCIAYIHDGSKYTVSLYSKTVDVSVICKAHGGGGHKGAAGFVCETLPWAKAK